MQILGLLGGMYFDAEVVFVENFSFLFRFALAILCTVDVLLLRIVKGSRCATLQQPISLSNTLT